MKILHICNDFTGSKVHSNLYKQLDKNGIEQIVFTTIWSNDQIGKNSFDAESTKIIYAPIRKKAHRFFFRSKINAGVKYLESKVSDFSEINLIHATTLFSDGAIALKLHRKYNLPYIVAIRDTDINDFFVKAPHTWNIGIDVLLNAECIVFISKALMRNAERHFIIKHLLTRIKSKFVLQPNGIDEYWLRNQCSQREDFNPRFCYVGRLERYKNIPIVIKAIAEAQKVVPNIHMDIVGDKGNAVEEVLRTAALYPNVVTCWGGIYDKDKLREVYKKNSVFITVSHHETFGLVYVEAISQGLNIIYTKNEGVDGLFERNYGIAVNSHSYNEIYNAILEVCEKRESFKFKDCDLSSYSWENIANTYINLYISICKRHD